jgi:acyl-CoA thioester hydrolase
MQHTSVSEIRVRYSETDQMGVAHHRHHLVWCEVGRTDFIREMGTSYAELERQGVLLAVAEVSMRYGAVVHYDDRIRVRTSVLRAQSRAVTFGYELSRIDGEAETAVASGETRLIAIDRSGSTRKLPDAILAGLRARMVPGVV